MTKDEATSFILKILNSKMAIMSLATKEQAIKEAEEHNITAVELLEKLHDYVKRI